MNDPAGKGFVAICDPEGTILRLVRPGPLSGCGSGPFHDMFDPGSREKFSTFLDLLSADGAAYNWEINLVGDEGAIAPYLFAGFVQEGEYYVIGGESPPALMALLEEMSAINAEYTNMIRARLKAVSLDTGRPPPVGYEEFTAVNNELVTMSRRLEKANRELRRLNDEKRHWMGVLAHDLRNPLGVISVYCELLERKVVPETDERMIRYLDSIKLSSNFMLDLVEQTLDLTAIESGKLNLRRQKVDVADLVRHGVELNALLAEQKSITLGYHGPDTPLETVLDKVKFEQVLNNLVGNAVKYTQPEGTVSVTLSGGEKSFVLDIADTGPGIRPEDRDRIFAPFTKTVNRPTGKETSTGLGLAITKRIVEGHGGRIAVESTVGEGSRFTVEIPLSGR